MKPVTSTWLKLEFEDLVLLACSIVATFAWIAFLGRALS